VIRPPDLGSRRVHRLVAGRTRRSTALVGAGYGLAAGIVATAVGLVFVASDGDHVTMGTATLVAHVAGAGAGAALLAALGVGMARSSGLSWPGSSPSSSGAW
jgi:hypothetical protein